MSMKATAFKAPKVAPQQAERLSLAAQHAYGNPAADEWFDRVMDGAAKYRARKLARQQAAKN
jgi:hypothetical protein